MSGAKPRIREAIIVEGRYDKNTVMQAVDALVVETGGFSALGDRDRIAFFRLLAEQRGVVILTDGDGAGFVIRGRLKGALPNDHNKVKHAYIPDIFGKERRKSAPSAEGKLGVEGMRREVIVEALRRAGCTFEDGEEQTEPRLTRSGFIALGLSGGKNSAALRAALQRSLGFPEQMSGKALYEALSLIYSERELAELISRISHVPGDQSR